MEADTLYYIMDYSGNYYQTSLADELIAAANEQDADLYTEVQASHRIGHGKKAAFYQMVPAENGKEKEENLSPIKGLAYEEVTEQVKKNVASYDLSEMDWAEYLRHFTYLVTGLKKYRDDLSKKHSDMDQKICDILHYVELCETTEEEAIDLVDLLRVCRENRRDIKDELQRIEYFQNYLGTNANAAKAEQALKSIKGLENRKYKPRKYEELFENSILKDRKLQKADLCIEKISCENPKRNYCVDFHGEEEGGEIRMEEKIYTPYDGKENDWVSFARQQAEFYRNASQYITNLQIAIREIDDEIEATLADTEDANCNVAQGYKVFKRLKELRLEKKNKTKELHCLYALTDYIDCDSLADTCEENLAEVEDIMEVKEETEIDTAAETPQDAIYVVGNVNPIAG